MSTRSRRSATRILTWALLLLVGSGVLASPLATEARATGTSLDATGDPMPSPDPCPEGCDCLLCPFHTGAVAPAGSTHEPLTRPVSICPASAPHLVRGCVEDVFHPPRS
jgi:hypothetical protein